MFGRGRQKSPINGSKTGGRSEKGKKLVKHKPEFSKKKR